MKQIHLIKPQIGTEEIERVSKVLRSGMLAEGPNAREFERDIANFTGAKYCTVTSNGTIALHLALEALDIQPGDEIITTGFTFIASSNAICFVGAIPKFVDIDDSWNIDPKQIEKAITPKTKAILPVHIFGLAANMPEIMEIAEKHDLKVIEDCAQSHGARIKGQHVGTFGDVGTFSLYATKNLISGEGGIITTNDEEIYNRARSIKNHGREASAFGGYHHYRIGYNFRMADVLAAVALEQLKKLPKFLEERKKNGEIYFNHFKDNPHIQFQKIFDDFSHSFYITAFQLTNAKIKRDEVVDKLKAKGIGSRPIYDTPVYRQPAYTEIQRWRWAKAGIQYPDYSKVNLPRTELLSQNHFEIPVNPSVTEEDAHYVAETLEEILNNSQ